MTDKLKVGDRLWWVPDHGKAGEVVVEKIGYRWATVGSPSWCSHMKERIDYQDERMPADGGDYQSPGRCYRSQEEWELSTRRDQLWAELKRLTYGSHQIPAHLDGDDLEDILNTLKGSETWTWPAHFVPKVPKTAADLRRLRSWLVFHKDDRRHLRLSVADARILAEDQEMRDLVRSFEVNASVQRAAQKADATGRYVEGGFEPRGAKLPTRLYGFDLAVDHELEPGLLWLR